MRYCHHNQAFPVLQRPVVPSIKNSFMHFVSEVNKHASDSCHGSCICVLPNIFNQRNTGVDMTEPVEIIHEKRTCISMILCKIELILHLSAT